MATLNCNSCGGDISSNARRVQCPHCGELFPFVCAHCDNKLRPAFPVFDDERYLTLDAPPLPLCDDHYLRKCPDCDEWFSANENPGYFRCLSCSKVHDKKQREAPAPVFSPSNSNGEAERAPATTEARSASVATRSKSAGNPNALAIGFAVCAFLALVAWMLFGR